MNKVITFIVLILAFSLIKAQNLVSNPGFEKYSSINDSLSINTTIIDGSNSSFSTTRFNARYDFSERYCIDWIGPPFSLRNRCLDSLGFHEGKQKIEKFENKRDTSRLTHSGMSSISILFTDFWDASNIIGTALIDTLCEGCKYNISFYIYVTEESNVIFNNIGISFNLPKDVVTDPMPDIKILSNYYLKHDKQLLQGEWQKIEYSYIARGDEIGFGFGKYYTSQKVKPLKKNQESYGMRIYLDDFSIVEVQEVEQEIPK